MLTTEGETDSATVVSAVSKSMARDSASLLPVRFGEA